MSQETLCSKCGATVSGEVAGGFCTACLLEVGLSPCDEEATSIPLKIFGDYELIEEIARGGMGVVFKARQRSLNRIVAVKMILSGHLASAAQLQRFRAEARAAAALQHPGVVAIHEVGEHEGLLFFSMDYVAGQDLAQLVREGPWSATRAAQCVRDIAEAIQYAHEHGVLHRDLKPSNVLMDANGKPHVTDFGLAKQLNLDSQLSTNDPHLTLSGQLLGSPNFMPPEQAAGKHRELTRASDVYSLGALLYHLITGRPPFLADNIPTTLRLVSETEPVAPRLLTPGVPRDLETICLKCLAKEPTQRYATAQDLANELGHFLRNEPIRVRPTSQPERIWRWCKRKPSLALTLLLLHAVFALGLSGIVWQWIRAEENARRAQADERKAETEAARSRQVAQFLKDMLQSVGPSVALGRDTRMLQEVLDKTAERVGEELKDQPDVEAELRNTLGEVYYAIGQVKNAEVMHRTALELRRKIFLTENLAVAASQHNLGLALYAQAEGLESEVLLREALATRRKLLGSENLIVAESLNSLGLELVEHNQSAEAENVFREALAIRRKLLPDGHPDLAVSLNHLATALSNEDKSVEAEALAREALAMQRKLLGNEHPDVAISLSTLATVLFNERKLPEAETIQREGVTIQRKLLGNAHPDLAKSLLRLATTLAHEGKLPEAETAQREGLAMLQKLYGIRHPAVDWPSFTLAEILYKLGKSAEAEAMFRETLAAEKKKSRLNARLMISTLNSLADLLRDQRKTHEADKLYGEALAIASELPLSDANIAVILCWSSYGLICTAREQGRLEEAESVFRAAMSKAGRAWINYPGAWELSADILTRRGKYRDAEQFFTNGVTLTVLDKYGNARPARGDFRARVGRWNEAAADFSMAVELEPENVENYHRLAPLLVQSGRLDAYREHCRRSLDKFANTGHAAVAERVVKDCLILSATGIDLETLAKMADVAASVDTNHPGINWIRVTKSLAEYRQGHWTNAVEWAERALANLGVNERDAEAYLVLAMAKHNLNLPDDARSALAKAVEIVETKLPKVETGDIGDLWGDWIIAHVLLNEATVLIASNSAKPSAN